MQDSESAKCITLGQVQTCVLIGKRWKYLYDNMFFLWMGSHFKLMSSTVMYCMLNVWVVLELWMENLGWWAAGSHYFMLVFPQHTRACCVCSQQQWAARLWIEINTMDKAIKALFVPFVTTGWGLKQSVFYQCQRCDETWLTQEANGIKAPICQPCSRPDRSDRKRPELYGSKYGVILYFFSNSSCMALEKKKKQLEFVLSLSLQVLVKNSDAMSQNPVIDVYVLRLQGFPCNFDGLDYLMLFQGAITFYCCNYNKYAIGCRHYL